METYKGKRFVGIHESDQEQMDSDFLKRFTGDMEITTRTLSTEGKPWEPLGELVFMSGSKPLTINERDKDKLDKVQRIVFHPAEPAPKR